MILLGEFATLCCENYNGMHNTLWARGRIFERVVTAGLYGAERLLYYTNSAKFFCLPVKSLLSIMANLLLSQFIVVTMFLITHGTDLMTAPNVAK